MEENITDQKPVKPHESILFENEMAMRLQESITDSYNKWSDFMCDASAKYCQTVEGSHRFTLYGLHQELIKLRKSISKDAPTQAVIIDHLLKGLQNSIDAGEDITKLI